MPENDMRLKTGTTTLGFHYRDGVILAADRRVTAGGMIMDTAFNKVYKIADNVAITISGVVSDAQLFTKHIKAEIKLKQFQTGRKIYVSEVANMLAGMTYSAVRSMAQGIAHMLVGGTDTKGTHLYDVGIDGSLKEIPGYCSSGSGSVFAYGVLDSDFKEGMSEEEAVSLAEKAIVSAIKRDTASGNGIDILVIPKEGEIRTIKKEVTQ